MERLCSLEVKEEYVSQIEKLLDDVRSKICNKKLFFWGAGNTAKMYWDDIKELEITPVYWIDSNAKEGDTIGGYSIYTPSKLKEEAYDYAIVIYSMCPSTYQSIMKEAQKYTKYICSAEALYYIYNQKAVLDVLMSLNDEMSVVSLGEALKCRILGETNPIDIVENTSYFPFYEFVNSSEKEVYVDLGAFKGDTMEKYIFRKFGVFGRYYAFEPLKSNYKAMEYRVERLKREWGLSEDQIVCVNAGCGKEQGELVMRYNPGMSPAATALPSNAKIEEHVPVVCLDDYFREQIISVLKMDIEGMEREALEGGKKVIKRDRPLLAISIYHRLSDIIELPKLISRFEHQYKLDIRCHTECFDDTVLYAW